jgi:MoaA/NifB/PqqE/SkfB family radical SAM enzyme
MMGDENFEQYCMLADSCESGIFSSYVNVKGDYWHCSFTEDHPDWKGVSMIEAKDFLDDVWYNPEVNKFRDALMVQDNSHICGDCRLCPVFDLYDPNIIGEVK